MTWVNNPNTDLRLSPNTTYSTLLTYSVPHLPHYTYSRIACKIKNTADRPWMLAGRSRLLDRPRCARLRLATTLQLHAQLQCSYIRYRAGKTKVLCTPQCRIEPTCIRVFTCRMMYGLEHPARMKMNSKKNSTSKKNSNSNSGH